MCKSKRNYTCLIFGFKKWQNKRELNFKAFTHLKILNKAFVLYTNIELALKHILSRAIKKGIEQEYKKEESTCKKYSKDKYINF